MRFVRCKTTRYGRNRPRCAELVQSATVRDVFADCRFEPAESAPGNSPSRKLTYYLRLFCLRPVRALGKSASTPSR